MGKLGCSECLCTPCHLHHNQEPILEPTCWKLPRGVRTGCTICPAMLQCHKVSSMHDNSNKLLKTLCDKLSTSSQQYLQRNISHACAAAAGSARLRPSVATYLYYHNICYDRVSHSDGGIKQVQGKACCACPSHNCPVGGSLSIYHHSTRS